jgi:hypothetical protein
MTSRFGRSGIMGESMNGAVLGGLVEQWVWRCQKIATQYQLRQQIDLPAEVGKLVAQAEVQARLLDADGPVLLAKIESRLAMSAHIAELPEPLAPDKLTDPVLNAAGRAQALHALANAFGAAAAQLKSAA